MKTLDVRNNRLTELPLGLCDLDLGLLDLQNNDLRTLPPQLARITTLRSMPLEGNPLKQIRREVVAGPISGLMKFLESRMPEEGQSRAPGRAGVTAAQAAQTAVRSGNVFGKDEGAMAADAIRMISLNAAAAQQAAAYSGGGGQYGQQQPQQAPTTA
ncbi:hypothetical protein FOA52_014197 [Chlamydomonas sp. UWO 241]|nr:hypothetical protein FOA52_014197 [Chlamydomonas sp. UWO 241]